MPRIRPLDPLFESKSNIIAYFRQAMKEQHINQTQMAEKMGMYQSGFSHKMSTQNLTMDDLLKMFKILGTPPEKIGRLMG